MINHTTVPCYHEPRCEFSVYLFIKLQSMTCIWIWCLSQLYIFFFIWIPWLIHGRGKFLTCVMLSAFTHWTKDTLDCGILKEEVGNSTFPLWCFIQNTSSRILFRSSLWHPKLLILTWWLPFPRLFISTTRFVDYPMGLIQSIHLVFSLFRKNFRFLIDIWFGSPNSAGFITKHNWNLSLRVDFPVNLSYT